MTPNGVMVSHSLLLAVSVDLPARALVLNTKQYNGKWGCCYCEYEGVQHPNAPMVRYWPPPEEVPQTRTHKSLIVNAAKAASSDPQVCNYQLLLLILCIICFSMLCL